MPGRYLGMGDAAPGGVDDVTMRTVLASASVLLIVAIALLTGVLVLGPLGLPVVSFALLVAVRSAGRASGSATLRALRARPLARWEAPELHDTVGVLAARAGLPRMPTLALLPAPTMNALATGGPQDPVIAVTPSLLRTLTPRQTVGVLAHEIAHLRAADLRVMGIAGALARFTQSLSFAGTLMLLLFGPAALAAALSLPTLMAMLWAPSVATLLLLALSRQREHAADADAVDLTGDAAGLAQALVVLERHSGAMWEAMAPGRALPPVWLRTHPTTEARVDRLRRLAARPRGAVGPGTTMPAPPRADTRFHSRPTGAGAPPAPAPVRS